MEEPKPAMGRTHLARGWEVLAPPLTVLLRARTASQGKTHKMHKPVSLCLVTHLFRAHIWAWAFANYILMEKLPPCYRKWFLDLAVLFVNSEGRRGLKKKKKVMA